MIRATTPFTTPRGSAVNRVPARSLARHLIASLRPHQWTKNLVIFAGLIFGQRLFDGASVIKAVSAFVLFCVMSGVVYLVNDIADRKSDRQHPIKQPRPIGSGGLRGA